MKPLHILIVALVAVALAAIIHVSRLNAHADTPGSGYNVYSFGALVGTVQTVKGTAVTVGGFEVLNSAATICYLQLFDVATGTTVTLGTTVPKPSLGFPAGAAGIMSPISPGLGFVNGLKIAATTTRTGSTPCGTGMDVNLWTR